MRSETTPILVVGAGLQGTGVALELASRGVSVTLLDRDEYPVNRASLRNEGKIHLGFIYANDPSLATAVLQLQGALRFRAIVTRWLGGDAGWLSRSTPFDYLVATDSILTPERLAQHYAAVMERCREDMAGDETLDYLGERDLSRVRPLAGDEIALFFDTESFAAGFRTPELAIDTARLALSLRRAVERSPYIRFLPCRTVAALAIDGDGFRVEGDGPDGPWSLRAQQVVNATWERRLAFDRQLGLQPPEGLVHRLKYRVIARLPDALRGAPSVSMVLGRYGDVVIRPDGTAYLSWYPAGLRGWSHDVEPPDEWNGPCRGELAADVRRDVATAILAGIDGWFPGMAAAEPLLVDAGAIVAIGSTDVDDKASGLHGRCRVGVRSHGGYHSVDPGKLTTAPMFAIDAADRVEAFERAGAVPAAAECGS